MSYRAATPIDRRAELLAACKAAAPHDSFALCLRYLAKDEWHPNDGGHVASAYASFTAEQRIIAQAARAPCPTPPRGTGGGNSATLALIREIRTMVR